MFKKLSNWLFGLQISPQSQEKAKRDENYCQALEKLEQAYKSGETKFSLSHTNLTVLPPEVGQLINLQELYLYLLHFTKLPNTINGLINLQRLYIGPSSSDTVGSGLYPFKLIPPEIGQLSQLITIEINSTQLNNLPPEIGQLNNLQTLNLRDNQLSRLPSEIGQLSQLQELNLSSNQLPSLPAEIGQLSQLQTLNLRGNQLSRLPAEIGQLSQLQELNLSSNQLASLPAEIGQLSQLQTLNLYRNQLSNLPPEIGHLHKLSKLDLQNNRFKSLPDSMRHMSNLEKLLLHGNPDLDIPPEILGEIRDANAQAILDYYFRSRQAEAKPLHEAKLILVGQGGAGKTTLTHWLIEGRFEPTTITHGINLRRWSVGLSSSSDGETNSITLNLWDFGGQEIMHATHQFFLTERAIYLVVWHTREDQKGSRLREQVRFVRNFAPDAPVLVVENRFRDQAGSFYTGEASFESLQAEFGIIAKLPVCLAEGHGAGISDLQAEISRIIQDDSLDTMRHIHAPVPRPEWEIKRELEVRATDAGDSTPYFALDQFRALCDQHGLPEREKQNRWLRILHELGTVIYFHDEPELAEIGILNPHWLTKAVYAIITNPDLKDRYQGELTIARLRAIFEADETLAKQYPQSVWWFILAAMKKFDLLFGFEGESDRRFLIPRLLPDRSLDRPDLNDSAWLFKYEYTHRPPDSIIPFLITKLNGFIVQNQYALHGVNLRRNKIRAFVRLQQERYIQIDLLPDPHDLKTSREFGREIRQQLAQIHQQFKGLKDKVKLLFMYEGAEVEYELLQDYLADKEYDIPLPVLTNRGRRRFKSFSIPEILGWLGEWSQEQQQQFSRQREIESFKSMLESLQGRLSPRQWYEKVLDQGRLYYTYHDFTLARMALIKVHEGVQRLRGRFMESETQRYLSAQTADLYEKLVHCYLVEENHGAAFKYATIGKGRAFVQQLAGHQEDLLVEMVKQGGRFAKTLKQALVVWKQINALQEKPDRIEQGLDDLLLEEDHLWEELETISPVLSAMLAVPTLEQTDSQDRVISAVETAQRLANQLQATLVEFYRHANPDHQAGNWCAFVIEPTDSGESQVRHVPLPNLSGQSGQKLFQQLLEWRNEVHLPDGRSPISARVLPRLHEAVIAPLGLQTERVILAPYQQLHLFPLGAAYDPASQSYLAARHQLSFVPSLTALKVIYDNRLKIASSETTTEATDNLLSVAYPGEPPLPNLIDEAEAIAQRIQPHIPVTFIHQQEATRQRVIQEAPHYRLIHFGCHGRFKADRPTESGLMLQEPLTVQDIISQLNLTQTRLATLAACLTGEVALGDGEEHVGLIQATLTAGVPTVVASLWRVDDAATRYLFEAFYSRQAQLGQPAQAMHEAASLLREKWPHPYYWSAFQVNGLPTSGTITNPTESPGLLSVEAWPPDDLLQSINRASEERLQRGDMIMHEERIIQNAAVLLKNLYRHRDEVLPALQKHTLSDDLAQQPMEWSAVGIAQTIRAIVKDNPDLQDFISSEAEYQTLAVDRATEEQKWDSKHVSRSVQEAHPGDNTVSDFNERFLAAFKEVEKSPQPSSEEMFQRVMNKLFGKG